MDSISINPKTGKTLQETIEELYLTLQKKVGTESESPRPTSVFETLELIEAAISQVINSGNEYEEMIQRLEADVRNHIRIEQQLKLHIESIQYKFEDHQKYEDISNDVKRLKETIQAKDKEIYKLQSEVCRKDSLEKKLKECQARLKELEIPNNKDPFVIINKHKTLNQDPNPPQIKKERKIEKSVLLVARSVQNNPVKGLGNPTLKLKTPVLALRPSKTKNKENEQPAEEIAKLREQLNGMQNEIREKRAASRQIAKNQIATSGVVVKIPGGGMQKSLQVLKHKRSKSQTKMYPEGRNEAQNFDLKKTTDERNARRERSDTEIIDNTITWIKRPHSVMRAKQADKKVAEGPSVKLIKMIQQRVQIAEHC